MWFSKKLKQPRPLERYLAYFRPNNVNGQVVLRPARIDPNYLKQVWGLTRVPSLDPPETDLY